MHQSETEGIPMCLPLNTILQLGDLLMLWTASEIRFDYLLVTSFVVHDAALFHLRITISVIYDNGRLHLLSELEPEREDRSPVHESLTIQLANNDTFRYRVLFLRDECHDDQWQFARLQPTLLSPCIALVELECDLDAGLDSSIMCLGPSDPWDLAASASVTQAVYWIPRAIYECALPAARSAFRAQVSHCPLWAFSTQFYHVHFLVHCLL